MLAKGVLGSHWLLLFANFHILLIFSCVQHVSTNVLFLYRRFVRRWFHPCVKTPPWKQLWTPRPTNAASASHCARLVSRSVLRSNKWLKQSADVARSTRSTLTQSCSMPRTSRSSTAAAPVRWTSWTRPSCCTTPTRSANRRRNRRGSRKSVCAGWWWVTASLSYWGGFVQDCGISNGDTTVLQ